MKHGRKLLGITGTFSAILGAVLWLTAGIAVAHHPVLDGSTSCVGPDHAIEWAIGNSQPKKELDAFKPDGGQPTPNAELNGIVYPVTGYTLPIAPSGSTTAQSTIPGALTGTVTLTVRGHWTDGHSATRTFDLLLDAACTTTTTTGPTTTTTTEVPRETTTTTEPTPNTHGQPPTTYTGPPASSGPPLAYTGSSVGGEVLTAFGLIGVGGALMLPPRRRRRARR